MSQPVQPTTPAEPFIEGHPHGDGYLHECAAATCGGTVGESDAMVFVDGEPMHESCWENGA